MIHYVSTRGQAGRRSFEDVLLAGLAEDGGLFVPESWPAFSADELRAMRALDYPALAASLLTPFTAGCFDEADLLRLARRAYAEFDHPATAPLRHLRGDEWLLELFHGPTLAFKDFAMQLLAACSTRCCRGAASGSPSSAPPRAIRGRGRAGLCRQARRSHRHAAPRGPRLAGAAAADDHERTTTSRTTSPSRHLRRLPGPGEGDVRRRAVPRRAAAVGGQLDQLGAGGGPDRLLCLGGPAPGRSRPARWRSRCRPAISATSMPDVAAAHGPAGRAACRRHQRERHTGPLLRHRPLRARCGSRHHQPVDGHPGGEQFRAAAARALEGTMPRARVLGCWPLRRAAASRWRGEVCPLFGGGSADQAEVAATIAATLRATGELVDPHTAVGFGRWARAADRRWYAPRDIGDGASGEVSRGRGGGCRRHPRLPPATTT